MDCFASLAMTTWHALRQNSMTPEVMDFGSGPRAALALIGLRGGPHRRVPDLLGIFADGAVRGEPRHARHVQDAGAGPGRHHLPARVDAALGFVIGIEIRADHVVVE